MLGKTLTRAEAYEWLFDNKGHALYGENHRKYCAGLDLDGRRVFVSERLPDQLYSTSPFPKKQTPSHAERCRELLEAGHVVTWGNKTVKWFKNNNGAIQSPEREYVYRGIGGFLHDYSTAGFEGLEDLGLYVEPVKEPREFKTAQEAFEAYLKNSSDYFGRFECVDPDGFVTTAPKWPVFGRAEIRSWLAGVFACGCVFRAAQTADEAGEVRND